MNEGVRQGSERPCDVVTRNLSLLFFDLLQALRQTPLNPADVVEDRVRVAEPAEDDRRKSALHPPVKFIGEYLLRQTEGHLAAAVGHFFEDDRETTTSRRPGTP